MRADPKSQLNTRTHPRSIYMRISIALALLAAGLLFASPTHQAAAQTNKTIILVRHAEKQPPVDTDRGDPDLSPDGRARAERLAKAIMRYKPHEIFATEYKRTQQTAEPTAKRRHKEIQIYDSGRPADLIAKIMPTRTDHYLIVGHGNTIPALANLLFKKEVFRQLPETEFGVFWVIRLKRGVVTRVEVFPY